MKIIGLTGGIGSGKSTVAGFLAELGATVIDADKIGHDVLESEAEVRQKIALTFGEQVLDSNGNIDRKKLAGIVFKNHELLVKLNLITHPPIYRRMQNLLDKYRQQVGIELLVIDAPLLIEAGLATKVDEIWITIAPQDVIIERLEKKGMTKEDIHARMHQQTLPEERMKVANLVINTDVPLEALKKAVGDLWQRIRVDTNRR
jgi:dephospho-CoA kinase